VERRIGIALAILSVCASPVRADESSHVQAAKDLLVAKDAPGNIIGGAEAMADAMVQQNPTLRPFRDVIIDWAERYMTWESIEDEFAALYVDEFTEEELRELIAFYETPVGRKSVDAMPRLMKQGAMIGARLGPQHSGELRVMSEERATEIEGAERPGGE